MQDGRCDVEDAHGQSHNASALLDAWPHGHKHARDLVTILEVVFRDNGGSAGVVLMRVVGLPLAQRLDAMVGDDE